MTRNPQLIIYTRNRDVDYRMVITPDENLCPSDTRKYFRKLIRGAIDVDTYDDPLTEPRWLYARKGNVILFGVATMLEQFNTECYTDFTGRNVRGFYGIIIDATIDSISLPYDLNFFEAIHKKIIEPYWNAAKNDFVRKNIEIDLSEDVIETISEHEYNLLLNTDKYSCQILGDVDIKDALQSAISYKSDISLITGFNTKQHAFASEADYSYMNAIVNGVHETETQQQNREKSFNPQFDNPIVPPPIPPRPKKAYRPKILLTLLIVITVLIAILLLKNCNTTQTSQNSSTSGEQNRMNLSDTIQKKF